MQSSLPIRDNFLRVVKLAAEKLELLKQSHCIISDHDADAMFGSLLLKNLCKFESGKHRLGRLFDNAIIHQSTRKKQISIKNAILLCDAVYEPLCSTSYRNKLYIPLPTSPFGNVIAVREGKSLYCFQFKWSNTVKSYSIEDIEKEHYMVKQMAQSILPDLVDIISIIVTPHHIPMDSKQVQENIVLISSTEIPKVFTEYTSFEALRVRFGEQK